MAKLSIYKYVRMDKGWRYCKAAFHPNGKIKPNVVLVSGVEEKHTEGRYFCAGAVVCSAGPEPWRQQRNAWKATVRREANY